MQYDRNSNAFLMELHIFFHKKAIVRRCVSDGITYFLQNAIELFSMDYEMHQ